MRSLRQTDFSTWLYLARVSSSPSVLSLSMKSMSSSGSIPMSAVCTSSAIALTILNGIGSTPSSTTLTTDCVATRIDGSLSWKASSLTHFFVSTTFVIAYKLQGEIFWVT
ncbi:uncharacterized protein LOC131155645 [Malania oleifera]|uniref:uncharacterized protein LOC131155645 n=1 Tax=Malania oleifera TaxID=397392 RepID=UPI0025AE741F|nr:uncharacterized protein LOC131155645 [Malania oleifera]